MEDEDLCEMTIDCIGNYYRCNKKAKWKIPDTKVRRGLLLCGIHKNVFERMQRIQKSGIVCERIKNKK